MKISDEILRRAIDVLEKVDIVKEDNGKKYIDKAFRGQISSFGAAVQMGSLLSAVAFFSSKGGSDVDRPKLMKAIYTLIKENSDTEFDNADAPLLKYVSKHQNDAFLKDNVLEAAVALKLAMNAYELRKGEKSE